MSTPSQFVPMSVECCSIRRIIRLLLVVAASSSVARSSWAFPFMVAPTFARRGVKRLSLSESRTSDMSSSSDGAVSSSFESSIVLLEHVNLNVPNHDSILPFYGSVLGMGLDPRRASNVVKGSGTVWVNCGASQFHLPFGATPQIIPGSIGLWFDTLDGLKDRLSAYSDDANTTNPPFRDYTIGSDEPKDGGTIVRTEFIRIVDLYGNVFYCRERKRKMEGAITLRQPILHTDDPQHVSEFGREVVQLYGRQETECGGIDYVEFLVPMGTADKIAEFYECIFHAPVTVLPQTAATGGDGGGNSKIAMVGIGMIDEEGRASQSILFRETNDVIPPYDGHHISIYAGTTHDGFRRAFEHCDMCGIVWVNPRFSDKATDWKGAVTYDQFRFKHVLDIQTGNVLLELEHEVRTTDNPAYPGHNH